MLALAVVAGLAFFVAGCVQSVQPLVKASDGVFPFKKLLVESEPGEWDTFVRVDDSYVAVQGGSTAFASPRGSQLVTYRLADLGNGYLLVQVKGTDEGKYSYAVIKIDPANRWIDTFDLPSRPAPERDKTDAASTEEQCGAGDDCFDSIEALRAYALENVARGRVPDGNLRILGMVK